MRDLLAVAGVIVLAVCLGVASAYLSVDLTPPGLDLIRPPKADVVAEQRRQAQQASIQVQAGACKYCASVADLAQRVARHASNARQQADALRQSLALDNSDEAQKAVLVKAERLADGAEAAAATLTTWASRCKAEDFCRAPARATRVTACTASASQAVAGALQLAAAMRRAANGCAAASCPSIDCQASALLRSDAQMAERALASAGGRFAVHPEPATLQVGASTLSAEVERINEEVTYISKMLLLTLGSAASTSVNGELPNVAAGLVDTRAISAAQLATVMEHDAELGGRARTDLRRESAVHVKMLAARLVQLGHETEAKSGAAIDWHAAMDAMGAALVEMARLRAVQARVTEAGPLPEGCEATAPAAAQQLREALSMLEMCRLRSSCGGSERSLLRTALSRTPEDAMSRGTDLAGRLVVEDVRGSSDVTPVSSGPEMLPIDRVRQQFSVCTRAAGFLEASSGAPASAAAVAEAAAPAGEVPGAAVSPQDLLTGAVNNAVQVSAPAGEPALLETSAARPAEASLPPAEAAPMFTQPLLSTGERQGEGGPVEAPSPPR